MDRPSSPKTARRSSTWASAVTSAGKGGPSGAESVASANGPEKSADADAEFTNMSSWLRCD